MVLGKTELGIPVTILAPVKLVSADPLAVIDPAVIPKVTPAPKGAVTVMLEPKVCGAVQRLLVLNKALALAGVTQVGTAPLPLLWSTLPLEPADPLAIRMPLRVSELPETTVMLDPLAPNGWPAVQVSVAFA